MKSSSLLQHVRRVEQASKRRPHLFPRCGNSHLPLDVVLQQVLIDGVQVAAAHVVVVVGHRVAELLTIGPVFHIVGLVAVVVIVVTLIEQKQKRQSDGQRLCACCATELKAQFWHVNAHSLLTTNKC